MDICRCVYEDMHVYMSISLSVCLPMSVYIYTHSHVCEAVKGAEQLNGSALSAGALYPAFRAEGVGR